MNEKEKMLGLMRFWLFGTFLIVFTATAMYAGGAVGLGNAILLQPNFWISMVITAVLCGVWYYIYKWYLNRQS